MSLPSRDVKESEITVDNLSPCTQYNFAVAAVLDGDAETEKSVSEEVTSPLDENEDFEAPNLVIHNEDRSVSTARGAGGGAISGQKVNHVMGAKTSGIRCNCTRNQKLLPLQWSPLVSSFWL